MDACVISLARTPERLQRFRARLGSFAEAVQWHSGVDGKTLNCDSLLAQGIIDPSALTWPRGQIGCALSHLSAWQWCLDLGKPLLIFEDDVQLATDWHNRLQALIRQLSGQPWDFLLLGCNQDSCLQIEWSAGHRMTSLFRPRYSDEASLTEALSAAQQPTAYKLVTALGLAGYVIKPEAAARLAEWVYPLRTLPIRTPELPSRDCFSLDGQLNSYYESIHAFVAFPPIAVGENNQVSSLTKR